MHFENLIDNVGDIGKLQIGLFLLTRSFSFFSAFNTYGLIFIGGTNEYWCSLDEYRAVFPNASEELLKNLAIPRDHKGDYSKCTIYELDKSTLSLRENISSLYDQNENTTNKLFDPDAVGNKQRAEVYCTKREFGLGYFLSSVRMEWDLVCERSWIYSLNRSLYMAGFYVGCLLTGIVSDWFGRKKALLVSWVGMCFMDLLMCFSPNFTYFTICRTILAICTIGSFTIPYCYAAEMIGQRWSVWLMVGGSLYWSVGYTILPLVAYFIRDWRILQIVISVPQVLVLLTWFCVPESPRWLFVHGKKKEVNKLMSRFANSNKRTWDPANLDRAMAELEIASEGHLESERKPGPGILRLLKTANLRKKTLVLCLTWFTVSMVFYGISLNTETIPGDLYVNTFLMSFGEYPSAFFSIYFAGRIGRKKPIITSFLLCGLLLSVVMFLPAVREQMSATTHTVINVSTLLVGKILSGIAFNFAYIMSVELMPTIIRNLGMLACNTFARFGAAIEPFLILLGSTVSTATFVFFCFASALAVLLLPETKGYNLADTLEEAEEFGKGRSILSCTPGEMFDVSDDADSTNNDEMDRLNDSDSEQGLKDNIAI